MPFGLSTIAVKAIAIGLAVLALMGAFAWFVHSEREIGAQKVRDEVAAATAAQKAADDAETQRRVDEQRGIVRDAQLQASASRAAAASAAAARDSFRVQLDAYVSASRGPRYSGPSAGSAAEPGDDPIGVLAKLSGESDRLAGIYAEVADQRRIRAAACEASYDALKTKHQ